MSSKRSSPLGLAIVIVLAIFGLAVLIVTALNSREVHPVNGDRIVRALAQYTRDLQGRGIPVPSSVTLETLVQSGYLAAEDAKAFNGAEVTFYANALGTSPQSVLVEARMPDGTVEAVMADGSVQGFTRSRWEEFLKRTAELKEPVRSDTNHPGSKVGSDR